MCSARKEVSVFRYRRFWLALTNYSKTLYHFRTVMFVLLTSRSDIIYQIYNSHVRSEIIQKCSLDNLFSLFTPKIGWLVTRSTMCTISLCLLVIRQSRVQPIERSLINLHNKIESLTTMKSFLVLHMVLDKIPNQQSVVL